MAKNNTKQSIGFLDQTAKTIAGQAVLTGDTTTDGIYTDKLTYTVASVIAK